MLPQGKDRRLWFRLATGGQLGVTYTKDLNSVDCREAALHDICGGGVRMGILEQLPIGTKVYLKFPFSSDPIHGVVVHRIWSFTHGIKFIAMDSKKENRLLNHINQEQRKLLRKRTKR